MNTCFALFNLGGGEIILILALILILWGAKILPNLAKGLGEGIDEFRKATGVVKSERSWSWENQEPTLFLALVIVTIIEVLALLNWLL
jgi:sec-independent protein translocase protein TatA